jgi:hypothetical protein
VRALCSPFSIAEQIRAGNEIPSKMAAFCEFTKRATPTIVTQSRAFGGPAWRAGRDHQAKMLAFNGLRLNARAWKMAPPDMIAVCSRLRTSPRW